METDHNHVSEVLYETSLCTGMLKNTDMVMVKHSKFNNNNYNNSNISNNYYAVESMYKKKSLNCVIINLKFLLVFVYRRKVSTERKKEWKLMFFAELIFEVDYF
jgi:hypothetical protein